MIALDEPFAGTPSGWRGLVRAFNANKTSWIGLALFVLVVLMAIGAPLLAPQDPNAQDLAAQLEGPSERHLFGTD
jgi:peptide/nickel transport system permease protein